MIHSEDVERIKAAVNMPMLAAAYGLQVNRQGWACCPLHDDSHASMKVYPGYTRNDGWHCFACGEGGSIFDFAARYDGLSFEQAARKIAATFGVPVTGTGEAPTREARAQHRTAALCRRVDQQAAQVNYRRMAALQGRIRQLEAARLAAPPFGELFGRAVREIERAEAELQARQEMADRESWR